MCIRDRPYLGKKQIQKVQTYDLEQFYATLSRTPRGLYKQGVKQTLTDKQKRQFLTGASIREVHAMLKTAFSYAVDWDLIHKLSLIHISSISRTEPTFWTSGALYRKRNSA